MQVYPQYLLLPKAKGSKTYQRSVSESHSYSPSEETAPNLAKP